MVVVEVDGTFFAAQCRHKYTPDTSFTTKARGDVHYFIAAHSATGGLPQILVNDVGLSNPSSPSLEGDCP